MDAEFHLIIFRDHGGLSAPALQEKSEPLAPFRQVPDSPSALPFHTSFTRLFKNGSISWSSSRGLAGELIDTTDILSCPSSPPC